MSLSHSTYADFLSSKVALAPAAGIDMPPEAIHSSLFGWQNDLVRWSLRKGRAAIFSSTGTGKTRMAVEWGRLTGVPTLFIAPLAVAQQTIREAASIGVEIVYARSQADAGHLTITNYEMVDRFDAEAFGAVVLDESSRLKDHTAKTRAQLIEQFSRTPYRLCCTATPAPNDIAELANHAEFLGILSRVEMLSRFFVHDANGKHAGKDEWRLKGHGRAAFYRWLASWGMTLQRPSDLGYSDDDFVLPPLTIAPVIIPTDYVPPGQLFATSLKGITDRAKVRKDTIAERVHAAVDLVDAEPDEQWLLWAGLNDEATRLAAAIPGAVNVEGSQSPEQKADALLRFAAGDIRVLVSKTSIAGHGLNFQGCARMAFVGLSDSFEAYHQAIRRCWRYGQTRPVVASIVLTEPEEAIYQNVLRKERQFTEMCTELVRHVAEYERVELGQSRQQVAYQPAQPMRVPSWLKGVAA